MRGWPSETKSPRRRKVQKCRTGLRRTWPHAGGWMASWPNRQAECLYSAAAAWSFLIPRYFQLLTVDTGTPSERETSS